MQIPDLIRKEGERSKIPRSGWQISNCMSHSQQNQHDNAEPCSQDYSHGGNNGTCGHKEYSSFFKTVYCLRTKQTTSKYIWHPHLTVLQADPSFQNPQKTEVTNSSRYLSGPFQAPKVTSVEFSRVLGEKQFFMQRSVLKSDEPSEKGWEQKLEFMTQLGQTHQRLNKQIHQVCHG